MTEIIILSIIIIGISWLGITSHEETKEMRDINTRLFARTWAHEKFLMKIYNGCPPDVQKDIEHYLNNVKEL